MFSIYGTAGRLFTGPLEQLRRVRGQQAVDRVGAIPERELDFLQAWAETGDAPAQAGANGPGSGPAAAPSQHGAMDAYASAASQPRHRVATVAELMSHPAVSLAAAMSARSAWQALDAQGLGQAPVLDGGGRLVGLLRREALAPPPNLATPEDWAAHWQQPVQALMRTPVPAVAPETEVRRVARLLVQSRLPGLPVVDDDGAVLGFISRTDLLRAVAQDPPLDLWA